MSTSQPPPLIALSPGNVGAADGGMSPELLLDRLGAALEAGLRGFLLREPSLSDSGLFELGRAVGGVLGSYRDEAWFGLHDRAHLAAELEVDALHLGYLSLPPAEARRVVGSAISIGLSVHASDADVICDAVDYCFFGPVFDTPSKRGLLEPTGVEALAARCSISRQPIWALGGVQPQHAASLLAAGAKGIAVLGGICGNAQCAERTESYLQGLK